jgi:hypothetical protein
LRVRPLEALPPLIAARAFFANTASQGGHQVSPDGQHLVWVAVQGTGPVLWVRPLALSQCLGGRSGGFDLPEAAAWLS